MIYNGLKIRDTPENYQEILKLEQLWTQYTNKSLNEKIQTTMKK